MEKLFRFLFLGHAHMITKPKYFKTNVDVIEVARIPIFKS